LPPKTILPFGSTPKQIDEGIVPDIDYLVFRKCTPSWQIIEDDFPLWDITYVTAGSAQYTVDGKSHELSAGDLLCMPPNHIRSAKTYKDRLMSCFAVNFNLKNLKGERARLPFPLISHIGEREDLVHLFHELVFIWMDRQPLYIIKTRALLLLILHRLFELIILNTNSTAGDYRIQKVTHYIAVHYSEKITVHKMADMIGLNPVYFGALFKRETGMTMNRYLIRTRVRSAENMLRSGEYRVGETALRCGYNDIFHFYKQFKEICGVSPSELIFKKPKY
jgi:AraC-like DNA-binding protein